MLFLFSLLAAVISTGVFDRVMDYRRLKKKLEQEQRLKQEKADARDKARAHREFVKQMKQDLRELNKKIKAEKEAKKQAYREERERRRNTLRLPPPVKLTKAHLIRTFENMDEQNMKICRNIVSKAAVNPRNARGREFTAFKQEVNKIIDKHANKKSMSETDKKFLKVAERLFIPESGWTKYTPVRSSWLITVKYNKPKKEMVVIKKNGTAPYHYYNVPGWAYVALIVKTSHAGEMWWKKWYWRWSTNPKWKGVKRKWQNKS